MVMKYLISLTQIYIFLFIYIILLIVIIWLVIQQVKKTYSDMAILLTRQGRWEKRYDNFSGKDHYLRKKERYLLPPEIAIPNRKGKLLIIHSEGKPEPLQIAFQKQEWLDSTSIQSIINNDTIQKILTPKNAVMDILIIIGAIGGFIAGLASLILLAIEMGVI